MVCSADVSYISDVEGRLSGLWVFTQLLHSWIFTSWSSQVCRQQAWVFLWELKRGSDRSGADSGGRDVSWCFPSLVALVSFLPPPLHAKSHLCDCIAVCAAWPIPVSPPPCILSFECTLWLRGIQPLDLYGQFGTSYPPAAEVNSKSIFNSVCSNTFDVKDGLQHTANIQ